MTPEVMNSLMTFYCVGSFIGFIFGVYELFKYKENKKEKAQYGMIAGMAFLSWFTVFAYIYGKITDRLKKSRDRICGYFLSAMLWPIRASAS